MDLNLAKKVKNALKQYNIKPFKGFGQDFLVDKGVLSKIIKAAGIKSTDIVLEIGPGTGTLTQELVKKAKMVVAIEKDPKMVEILKEVLKNYKNLEIIQADVLRYEFRALDYKIVANLPYYITSPVIRKFLEAENPPESMVLMVQKEVGQRICAKPPKMNLLAVSVQFYGKPEIIGYVPKKSFWPQPKIDSAILKISDIRTPPLAGTLILAELRTPPLAGTLILAELRTPPLAGTLIPAELKKPRINTDLFFRIVKAGFSQPRKYIANNFMRGLALPPLASLASGGSLPKGVKLNNKQINNWLSKNKISPKQRAESLTVENWINLTKTLRKFLR